MLKRTEQIDYTHFSEENRTNWLYAFLWREQNKLIIRISKSEAEVTTVHSTYKHVGYKYDPFINTSCMQNRLESSQINGSELGL